MAAEKVAAAALCLGGAVALRAPAFGLPLDRDSAVYAVVGRGLLHGRLPYVDYYDHKQPLVYPAYALLDWLAPRSAGAIHLAAALLGGAVAFMLFVALRRALGLGRAALAAALALILGASRYVEGFDFNTEHLMTLFGTLAVSLALLTPGRHAFWIGALIGLATLGKAVGILLAPAALAPLVLSPGRGRSVALFCAGVAAPILVVVVFYAAHGALGDLWTWNVTFNRAYTAALSLSDRVHKLRGHGPVLLLAALAAVAAVVLVLRRRDVLAWTLALWLAGAFAGALIGGYGYAHYFFPVALPAAALLAAPQPRAWLALAVVAALPFAFDLGRSLVNGTDWLAARAYGGNARVWRAYVPVGRRLRALARPGDRLYVGEDEAGFYWQSGLRPASRLLYESALDRRPSLLPGVARAVCHHPPRFVVLPSGSMFHLPCLYKLGYDPVPGHDPAVVVLER